MSERIRYESAERVRDYYRNQGAAKERERIIELLERLPFIWGGTTQMIQTSRNEVITLIKGETE
jgi:hypothetical protein